MVQQGKVKTIAMQRVVFIFVNHLFPRICFFVSFYVALFVRYELQVKMFVTMYLRNKATKFH